MRFVAGGSGLTPRSLLPFSAAGALTSSTAYTVTGYAFSQTMATAGDTAMLTALVAIAALITRSRFTRARALTISN
jgi:membrane protein DedA with SNARE-associated domain